MNPDTNRLEPITAKVIEDLKTQGVEDKIKELTGLVRPDSSPVPKHWSIFAIGEKVVIKDYTFEIKYLGETAILVEPVGYRLKFLVSLREWAAGFGGE